MCGHAELGGMLWATAPAGMYIRDHCIHVLGRVIDSKGGFLRPR